MALQLAQDWTSRCTLMWPISILGQVVRLKFANDTESVRASSRLLSLLACALLGLGTTVPWSGRPFWVRFPLSTVALRCRLRTFKHNRGHIRGPHASDCPIQFLRPRYSHQQRSDPTPAYGREATTLRQGCPVPSPLRPLSAGSIKACDAAFKQPTWNLCRNLQSTRAG